MAPGRGVILKCNEKNFIKMSAKTAVRSKLRQNPVTNPGILGEVVPKEGF